MNTSKIPQGPCFEDDDDVPELLDDSSDDEGCEVDGQVHACAHVLPTRRASLVGSSSARGIARVEGKLPDPRMTCATSETWRGCSKR